MKKAAIITGGAKGIGLAVANIFADNGAQVCIIDIDEEEGKKVQDNSNGKIRFIKADVSNSAAVQQAVKECVGIMGYVDYLINNAGIQRYASAETCTEDEWDLVMNVNLKSYFLCTKYCIPYIRENGGGCIVNVASVQSFVASANAVHYITAKTALLGFTRSVAVDFAPGIRCVAVCPGTVYTPMVRESWDRASDPEIIHQESIDMHLLKRVAQPEEIAALIHYLCSPVAGFITGQAFRIDGGLGIAINGSVRQEQEKK